MRRSFWLNQSLRWADQAHNLGFSFVISLYSVVVGLANQRVERRLIMDRRIIYILIVEIALVILEVIRKALNRNG